MTSAWSEWFPMTFEGLQWVLVALYEWFLRKVPDIGALKLARLKPMF